MKHSLTDQDRARLDKRIAAAEKKTGTQIVVAVIDRSDSYPELPWKAFALGAALAGLLVVIMDIFYLSWILTVFIAVNVILLTGACSALLTIIFPGFARLFLHSHRGEVEVHQYAKALFLSRELFATNTRTGILLLISMFERKIVLLPDSGLNKYLPQAAIQTVIARMQTALAAGQIAHAFGEGINALETFIPAQPTTSKQNELSNEIIEEKGL
ncbi:MAG: TPM domain-containing protein [Nitrospirota bacterium]